MLFFELYRQLDIRMFQTMAAVDPTYGSCAKYLFDRDSLVLLGTNHSIRLDILSKNVSNDNPVKNWDYESEAVLWFAEDSTEAAVVRLINDAFRKWLSLDANITEEYFLNELNMVNSYLAGYDLKIFVDDTGMSIFKDGAALTFEQAIEYIMEVDENRMDDDGIEALISESFYYRNMDRYEEAAIRLEKVARYVDHTLPIYTNTVFSLAETYYFMGNYERAVQLYYRINMNFIADEEDFYMHLGHALLDEKMRRYDRHLRIYYHSLIDPKYADTHRQAVASAKGAVAEVFEEYSETCLEMGKKKFEEHKKSLPEQADDIDELLNIYENPEEKPDVTHKQIDDIKLREPHVVANDNVKAVNELLSQALDLYLAGSYQDAFDIYFRLKEITSPDSDYYSWVYYQLGKLYLFFNEPQKAVACISECDPNRFGMVYRQEDFLLLARHAHIVNDDFESDARFRVFVRGRLDPYYAQYSRDYNLLMRDKKLVKSYGIYEKDCIDEARYDYRDVLWDYKGSGGGWLKRGFKGLFGRR